MVVSKCIFLSIATSCAISLLWLMWYNTINGSNKKGKPKKKKSHFIPGLLNVGNTCFMNVVLQSLASASKLYAALLKTSETQKNKSVRATLSEIVTVLNKNTELSYYDPSHLLIVLNNLGWHISMEEHDAHEFFHVLMTTLDEELKRTRKEIPPSLTNALITIGHKRPSIKQRCISDFTDARNLLNNRLDVNLAGSDYFQGLLSIRLTCGFCGRKNSVKFDRFDSLSLPIPEFCGWAGKTSMTECLRQFFAPENVRSVDCDFCSRSVGQHHKKGQRLLPTCSKTAMDINYISDKLCRHIPAMKVEQNFGENATKVQRNFNREVRLAKLPHCLAFHLQRLVWKRGFPVKKQNHVEFEEFLNLGPFLYLHSINNKTNPNSGIKPNPLIEKLLSKKHNSVRLKTMTKCGLLGGSSSSVFNSQISKCDAWYKLCAVVVHLGEWTGSGHYVAYRRILSDASTQKWVLTSDTLVRPASITEVLSCPAYMLFYERM